MKCIRSKWICTLIVGLTVPVVLLAFFATKAFAYSKPVTWGKDSHSIVFKDLYNYSPHAWIIGKAIELLRRDGYQQEADTATKYLLPMLEGVTFNDVWGDADLAGASVLDYYVPDNPGQNFGFGGAAFAYKNDTQSYQQNGFYGYGNAAEHAQFRYDYAKRIATGHWGDDPRDLTAGWVVDNIGILTAGQYDPQNGKWAQGANLDSASGSRWGDGQTPASALNDMFQNHMSSQVVFPSQSDPLLSTIYVPAQHVLDDAPEWLDDHFNNADDIEAYSGYDGHGFAVYANWTLDAGGSGPNCSGCFLDFISFFHNSCDASPMFMRFPVNSPAHAYFQLGWAIHFLEDVTTPVHTINSSFSTYEVHNDIEHMADNVIAPGNTIYTNDGHLVQNALPSLNLTAFQGLFPTSVIPSCSGNYIDPTPYYKARWYGDTLSLAQGESAAHAYVRQSALVSNKFKPYIECMNTEANLDWNSMGHFTAYGLDLAIKSTAGLIRTFIEETDKTPPTITITSPTVTSYAHSTTLTLGYSAVDDATGIKSLSATLDGSATLSGQGLASGRVINLLTQMVVGTHTFVVTAVDNAGNTAQKSVTFTIAVTPASIKDDVTQFAAAGKFKNSGQVDSLLSKLNDALAARAVGNCGLAAGDYNAFIHEINAQTNKSIDAATASILIQDAQYLIAHCP